MKWAMLVLSIVSMALTPVFAWCAKPDGADGSGYQHEVQLPDQARTAVAEDLGDSATDPCVVLRMAKRMGLSLQEDVNDINYAAKAIDLDGLTPHDC